MTKAQGKPAPALARRFRDFIREARIAKGFSLRQLSEATSLSINTLQKYEGTNQIPSAAKSARLCIALDIDPRDFLRFALGDGKGEHLQKTDPHLCARYDELLNRVEAAQSMRPLAEGIKVLRFLLDMIEGTTRIAGSAMENATGSISEQLASVSLPEVMSALVNDPAAMAQVNPQAVALLQSQMKSGSDREDPSRPIPKSKPENAVGAASKRLFKRRRIE